MSETIVADDAGSVENSPTEVVSMMPQNPTTESMGPSGLSPSGSLGRGGLCIKMLEDPPHDTDAEAGKARDQKAAEEKKVADPKKPGPGKVAIPPELLKWYPVLHDPARLVWADPPNRLNDPQFGTTDNSNTQFAILALWAAGRHGVPTERSLKLMVHRYHTSQNADGSWGYRYKLGGNAQGSPAMTAVGLLGLAVGHGLAGDAGQAKQVPDPRIVAGFVALTRHVRVPAGRMRNLQQVNLYFLWSVERVGVLYDLPTIGNKDWYRWGAEILVANQQADGNWTGGGYHGANDAIDTCLALLFLKRANLAQDLTTKIPFQPEDLSQEIARKLPSTPVEEKPRPPDKPADPPVVKPTTAATDPKPPQPKTPPELAGSQTTDGRAVNVKNTPTQSPEEASDSGPSGGLILGITFLVILLVGCGFLLYMYMTREEDRPRKRRRKKTHAVGPADEDRTGRARRKGSVRAVDD
jgi:hypothetical protein